MPGPRRRPRPRPPAPPPPATPAATIDTNAPNAYKGWADLRWTINHRIPGAIRQAQQVNLATRFTLIRAYKVG